jgi:ATP-dependent protease Clp ATPase subunit
MSGAFSGLEDIIKKRTSSQGIGFGAAQKNIQSKSDLIRQVKAEDLISYGFESEFVGRLPVKAVFEPLEEEDLLKIMHTPNNPVLLNKKLDFATYGIDIRFSDEALSILAQKAYSENTGARGLVSVIEQVLIPFETKLPSTKIKRFPVTDAVIKTPKRTLDSWLSETNEDQRLESYKQIAIENKESIIRYLNENRVNISDQHEMPLSAYRIEKIAEYYCGNVSEIGNAVKKIKSFYDKIKKN